MMRFPGLILAFFLHAFVFLRVVFWTMPSLMIQIWRGRLYAPDSDPGVLGEKPFAMFLSFVEWEGAWQRPQHLASGFATQMESVYVSPVRAHNAPLRSVGLFFDHRQREENHLVVLSPLFLPWENRSVLFRSLNAFILFDAIRREVAWRGRYPRLLLTNSPYFALPFTWLPAGLRGYDIMDELVRFRWAPRDATQLERVVMSESDVVTSGTYTLSCSKEREYEDLVEGVRYIPCGVDADHFSGGVGECPADLRDVARPIIGYFGAINERVNPEVLLRIAREMPDCTLVLIGPVYQGFRNQGHLADAPVPQEVMIASGEPLSCLTGADREALRRGDAYKLLRSFSNVRFLGLKPYGVLPSYLAQFDVAIVPYYLSDGVEFVQPVKVLEYLAGGKPVVSTAIPDVERFFSSVVHCADSPADFTRCLRDAIGEAGARAAEYRAFARKRSWGEVIDEFATACQSQITVKGREPLRVAQVLHGEHLGGAEEMAMQLVRQLAHYNVEGLIVFLGMGENVRQRVQSLGVPWVEVPMRSKADLGVVLPLISILRARRISLLQTHSSRTNLVGRIASQITGIPVVTTVHTAVARDINDLKKSNRLNVWVEQHTEKLTERMVTVSSHNRKELIDQGTPAEKVVHIPNGVETVFPVPSMEMLGDVCQEFPALQGKPPIVGMLASMRPRKGADVLIEAFGKLCAHRQDVRLLMVGSAEFVEREDYLDTLRKKAIGTGYGEHIVFTGHRDDARTMLALMDVVVLPSRFGEGMPLALLEAMALGKPVVASDTEGNREVVVDGETGFLTPAEDVDALVEALEKLLSDLDHARAMGWAGRKRVEQAFSLEKMAENYLSLYRNLVAKSALEPSS